jgi:hypothetical protein
MKITILSKYFLLITLSISIGVFIGYYKPIPQAVKNITKGYKLIPLDRNEQNLVKSEIKIFLFSEISELNEVDELTKIILLRDYIHSNFQVGTHYSPNVYYWDMKRYFTSNIYSNSDYSGLCLDFAVLYHIALYAFDIPSRIVGLFTHVNQLSYPENYDNHVSVEVYYSEKDSWIINDPTFNVSVTDSDNRFISYLRLQHLIRNGLDYTFTTNGKYVNEDRAVENYYIPYENLINYIYTSQYATWDGIIKTDQGENDFNDDYDIFTIQNRRFRLK